jgi:hypothetical protein
MCAAAMGCSAWAKALGLTSEPCRASGGSDPAQRGQSMPGACTAWVESPSAETSFMLPEAEQTICNETGWISGEAMAAPVKRANQTSTQRAIVTDRKILIIG